MREESPSNEDLARSIQSLDQTLSEVLVLLYHVVQANESLVDALQKQKAVPVAAMRFGRRTVWMQAMGAEAAGSQ